MHDAFSRQSRAVGDGRARAGEADEGGEFRLWVAVDAHEIGPCDDTEKLELVLATLK